MTNGWVLPDGVLRDAPAFTPRPTDLADLELLVSGAFAPLTGYLGRTDLVSMRRTGRLSDGTPWPVPLTLEVPTSVVDQLEVDNPLKRVLVLSDAEGAPVAAVDVTEVWPAREGTAGVAGPVRRIGEAARGPFRRLRRSPAEVREALPPGRVLG